MDQAIIFEFDYAPEEMPVEKDAKIFEAGEYPDKEISITEQDLDAMVDNFTEVPVKVEHTDSPLDPLGAVLRVWRRGKELFARLAFPRDLAAFLERRGVKKLSVALYKDPLRLAEVSLVLSPRVPSAAMFGERSVPTPHPSPERRGESSPFPHREGGQGVRSRNPHSRGEVSERMSETEQADREKEVAELRFALRVKDVEARLAELKAQGKIVPASEPYAREILLQGDEKVTFGDGETTVAELFERFLEAQPKVVLFSELAPAVRSCGVPLSAEDEELLQKLGITREQLQRYA